MKRRRHGRPPTSREPKVGHLGTPHPIPNDVVAALTEQVERTEIREKVLAARNRRRVGNASSKQPPPSEEMKNVTEIGGRRWKLGQTK